ncbi:hypothetical protein CRENBAI_000166 [Crenichthys baileyi]|uniref:Uncharacterized protein n=1 Tax=Crenichthys baileyi TaxID=28760 RepID=A0AAV9R319_9TELE
MLQGTYFSNTSFSEWLCLGGVNQRVSVTQVQFHVLLSPIAHWRLVASISSAEFIWAMCVAAQMLHSLHSTDRFQHHIAVDSDFNSFTSIVLVPRLFQTILMEILLVHYLPVAHM